MKRILSVFIICFVLIGLSKSQEQIPVEQKVAFGQDGKLFINKDLGVYLWLSTSPEEGASKIRLISDSSKKQTNPMYFDTEGYNTVRSPSAVDTSSKRVVFPLRDIIFEVYSDSRVPTTKIKIEGKLKGYQDSNKKYKGEVRVSLSAFDKTSGVEEIFISVNGEAYKKYIDPISLKEQASYTIKYYSTDKVGNREEAKSIMFSIE